MIVALVGNDGSGKTTLCHRLNEQYPDSRVIEEFDYPFLGLIKRFAGRGRVTQTREAIKTSHPVGLIRMLPYAYWFDILCQTLYLKLCYKRKTVILDRCLYDHLATWRELGLANRFVERLYAWLPRPDLALFISVDPQLAWKRRSDQKDVESTRGLDFYIQKKVIYEDLRDNFPIATVDNNTGVEAALKELVRLVELRNSLVKYRRIAISGLDGAGKTTTMNNLEALLTSLNIKHKYVHFYYNYSLLKLLRRLKRPKAEAPIDVQYRKSIEHELKSVSHQRSKFWVAAVILDAYLQYYYFVLRHPRRLILFDRFFYDYLVSFNFLKVRHDREQFLRSFPKPQKYFLLVGDPHILHERKPEHTLGFFEDCYSQYLALAKEVKAIELLDSTHNSPQKILHQLTQRLARA
jgi:thymidylate kinase